MNTFRAMYGLCKRYEIETEGKTPHELWREIHEAEERKKRETAKRMGVDGSEDEDDDKPLTDEEEAAIIRYTGSKSYLLNEALRNGEKLSPEYKKWAKNLNSAIKKLPKYRGTVTRSVWQPSEESLKEFLKIHEVGSKVKYKSFISTTHGDVCNAEANVQMTILNSRKGADISEYYDGESEVLYGTDSEFYVDKKYAQGNKVYFDLKEV